MVLSKNLFQITLTYLLVLIVTIFLINIVEFNHEILKYILQITMVFLILISILIFFINRTLFQPLELLILITLLYFFTGGINWIERGAFVDYNNELMVIIYITTLLFSTSLTYVMIPVKQKKLETVKNKRFLVLVILVSMIAIFLDWISIGGIPILFGNELRGNSQPIFRLFFLLGAFSSIILYHQNNNKYILLLFFIFGMLSGYRTFVMVYSFYIMLYFFSFGNFSFKKKFLLLLSGIILFFFINLLKLYRDIEEFGIQSYLNILEKEGLSYDYLYLSPILHTIREGPQMLQKIQDNTQSFGNGSYFLENLSTILPGKQRGYGIIFNNIVNAPTANTKTATILGAFYIDGGIYAIILFTILIGFTLGYLSKHYMYNKENIFYFVPMGYFISYMAIWTHGGSPFTPTFFIVSVMLFCVLYISRKKIV